MKKMLLFAFLVIATSASYAQLNKGQWLLGGQASFESKKTDIGINQIKSSFIELSPDAGYFIADKLVAGVRAGYFSTRFGSENSKSSTYSVVPFIRYYILAKQQKVNLFADASYGFRWEKQNPLFPDVKSNALTIQAGPSFFLTPHVALEFTLGYMYAKQSGTGYTSNTLKSGLGFKIHLGNSKSKK